MESLGSKKGKMMFHSIKTLSDCLRHRKQSHEDFYWDMNRTSPQRTNRVLAYWENQWCKSHRPYYNMYPSLIPSLLRLKLHDVPIDELRYPMIPIGVRLPIGQKEILINGQETQWLLICQNPKVLLIWFFYGEYVLDQPIRGFIEADVSNNRLLLRKIDEVFKEEEVYRILTLAVALGLLSQDHDLVSPDVLAVDRDKDFHPRLIEKAHKRKLFSWSVGRDIEICPHFRGPSPFATYWVGKGRKIKKIRYRKGAIVHRKRIKLEKENEGA